MAIPLALLKATESRAPGVCAYGGAGLKKTHILCTFPPPVLLLSVGEGGTGSVLPWIRRRRLWNEDTWSPYTDADRQTFLNLLDVETRPQAPLKPGPYIDVVHYDNSDPTAWTQFETDIGNFEPREYNTLGLDSLQEFSILRQTNVKGAMLRDMNDISFGWVKVQERCNMMLRKIRNYRDGGVFIYMTASQDIAKDYVKNPMQKRDQKEPEPEAYSIKGTVALPGQLAEALSHIPDIMCRARLMSGRVVWVTEPEHLPGADAHWDAKDRYGRLPKYIGLGNEGGCPLNFRSMMELLYGKEGKEAIMKHCMGMVRGREAA